jgi:hypothetical protein
MKIAVFIGLLAMCLEIQSVKRCASRVPSMREWQADSQRIATPLTSLNLLFRIRAICN